ncbi:hypothetical protein BOTBODRAFT_58446 [Botryobasidium botryosum FD-172 SS1]|uniref:Delta(14)-sterol reductase ERG24 n=1 Tax=Botryobasidium botryosum (strain FD-172 SS1) TaxID=930990 RepID=A0A067M2E1_BOTB1|nr:hypothetical protein BOTBODRAFT_58446 [Botryobasidium botryosum FD-172 SS1]
MSRLNPKSTPSEFLGTPGTALLTVLVPSFLYILYFTCSEASGGCTPSVFDLPIRLVAAVQDPSWWISLWDTEATLAYLAWFAFTVVAWAVLPGDWVPGTELRNGEKKLYKINALPTFLGTMGLVAAVLLKKGPSALTYAYDHWVGLVTASVLFSFLQSLILYIASFRGDKLLALGGNSDSHIYNFWIGRELNPSIGSFDIKSFCELRPGLILWVLIDISMACEQAIRRGGWPTDSMILVVFFQTWYVFDALYNEAAIFTTMDITTDGFGFMLSVGDLAWVPFSYTLQARYLAFHPVELGWARTALIVAVALTGQYIFRVSNNEKNEFRNGKNPKNLSYMPTERGTKLLTSGWWGVSRHPNYMGDLLMGLAWCLPTGFDSPIPYFYFFYFAVLLAHRQYRDDEMCAHKYGKDWEKYKKLVPWKIIPNVY